MFSALCKPKRLLLAVPAFLFLFLIPSVSAANPFVSTTVIMPVFLIILFLGLLMALIGFGSDYHYIALVGFVFLFFTGFIVEGGHLGVKTGETQVYDYTTNTTTITDTYAGWTGANYHLIGWSMMIVSGLMFGLTLFLGGDAD